MDRFFENNQATIAGEISAKAEFSHEIYGEKFYIISMKVQRRSGYEDEIPVTISERMCNVKELWIGQHLAVYGQFRSFNLHDGEKSRLVLSVFAREMEILDDMQFGREENIISLDGYICKKPNYRKTPLGREIADVLLAVNRNYGKSDYIPCIAWGRNARYASSLDVGTKIKLCGRIQRREYIKRMSDTEVEKRTAYEVSVNKIEIAEE